LARRQSGSSCLIAPAGIKKIGNAFLKDSATQVDEILLPLKQAEARLEECQRELLSQGVVQTVELSQISLQKHDATRKQLELVTKQLTQVQDTQANLPNALQDTLETFSSRFQNVLMQQMKNHCYIFVQDQLRMNMLLQGAFYPPQVSSASNPNRLP
jgi:hypothetical protein